MRRALLVAVCLVLLGSQGYGQEGSTPPVEKPPVLNSDQQLLWEGVVKMAGAASRDCSGLPAMKEFLDQRAKVVARFNRIDPLWDFNGQTGAFEKKKVS